VPAILSQAASSIDLMNGRGNVPLVYGNSFHHGMYVDEIGEVETRSGGHEVGAGTRQGFTNR
jgi:hypothetical protein